MTPVRKFIHRQALDLLRLQVGCRQHSLCRQTLHRAEHHLKALEGSVAADQRGLLEVVSSSKGISQSPVQFPEGQSEAPKSEQLPAQLAPNPQVASSIVLFGWQQLTITDWSRKVKTLSKKSTDVEFLFPESYS